MHRSAPLRPTASSATNSEIPTSGTATIHEAYSAAGYSFNVNKQGVLELLRQDGSGGSQRLWGGQVNKTAASTVNSVGGLQLEVRTHNTNPGWMQLLVNGQVVGEVTDNSPVLGEHTGLVASTSSGRVRFGNREVFDVSYQHQTTYTLHTDGMLDVDVRMQLAACVAAQFYGAASVFLCRCAGRSPEMNLPFQAVSGKIQRVKRSLRRLQES